MKQYKIATGLLKKRKTVIRGFSLIEVAIAIVVLGLVAGTVISVFAAGAKAARKTQQQTIAYNLLREKLEEKFSWPPSSEALTTVTGFTDFQRQVTVTSPYLGNANLARINVTVQWDAGLKNQTVETIKANY